MINLIMTTNQLLLPFNNANSSNLIQFSVKGNVYWSGITIKPLTFEVNNIDCLVTMAPVKGGIY